jgi:hypothetical protein
VAIAKASGVVILNLFQDLRRLIQNLLARVRRVRNKYSMTKVIWPPPLAIIASIRRSITFSDTSSTWALIWRD